MSVSAEEARRVARTVDTQLQDRDLADRVALALDTSRHLEVIREASGSMRDASRNLADALENFAVMRALAERSLGIPGLPDITEASVPPAGPPEPPPPMPVAPTDAGTGRRTLIDLLYRIWGGVEANPVRSSALVVVLVAMLAGGPAAVGRVLDYVERWLPGATVEAPAPPVPSFGVAPEVD